MTDVVNIKTKNVKLYIFFPLVLIIGIVIALNLLLHFSNNEIKRVWLFESGEKVSYFILEETHNNYLIIREHVLEIHEFVYPDSEDSYYVNSALDDFLNKEFINVFFGGHEKVFY